MAEEKAVTSGGGGGEKEEKTSDSVDSTTRGNEKKKRKGLISRIWNFIFRSNRDNLEKRLQSISKEESSVMSRMNNRSRSWRRASRHIIIFSVLFEVIAVAYAIMTTRTVDMNWKMRAIRVLPMFLLPAFSSAAYSTFVSFIRMCDRRDQKTLDRLRAERKEKIDDLKEKTNYYITQQLIQKYDTDPAAKAAAATVLASKLGAESGLKLHVADESKSGALTGKTNNVEPVQSSGLRNRRQGQAQSTTLGTTAPNHPDQQLVASRGTDQTQTRTQRQVVVVEHHQPQSSTKYDGGWIAQIAALLVGEDPKQSYALICGNCYKHNGLARREDFPFITYYCPHCHALNKPKHSAVPISALNSSNTRSEADGRESVKNDSIGVSDSLVRNNEPVNATPEIEHTPEEADLGRNEER